MGEDFSPCQASTRNFGANFGNFISNFAYFLETSFTKKPVTRVSKRVPGVHGKRGLERGWQRRLAKGWRKVGEGLAKGLHRVGEGLAKGWRISLHPLAVRETACLKAILGQKF